jgi:hypothetical protein
MRLALVVALLAAGASGETTSIEGDLPVGLAGRWLVVEQNRLPTGMVFPHARLWEIRGDPGRLELVLVPRRVPERVASKVAAAGHASRAWAPDEGDLRELAERWDDLPAAAEGPRRIEHRLAASAEGGLVVVTDEWAAGAFPVRSAHRVYGLRETGPGRLAGTFTSAATVDTPEPVTIALRGEVQAYRLPATPPRGRLGRVLDALLGRHEPS